MALSRRPARSRGGGVGPSPAKPSSALCDAGEAWGARGTFPNTHCGNCIRDARTYVEAT